MGLDIFGGGKKGPKTGKGIRNKLMTGDGRCNPTFDNIINGAKPKKRKSSKKKK